MKIRDYKTTDCDEISRLFYETIHTINAGDYTREQLFAWASGAEDLKNRKYDDLLSQRTLVALDNCKIIGFASIDVSGELDLVFVHKDYQRQKVATMLCDELEKRFAIITTYSSLTARGFFEKRGYILIEDRETQRKNTILKNYKMVRYS